MVSAGPFQTYRTVCGPFPSISLLVSLSLSFHPFFSDFLSSPSSPPAFILLLLPTSPSSPFPLCLYNLPPLSPPSSCSLPCLRQPVYCSVQFSSVTQSCPTLCDPMNRSTPGLPVLHQLPEFTQTHVHRVSDAIQPSHPLSSPSPPAPNPSQHQSLFQ